MIAKNNWYVILFMILPLVFLIILDKTKKISYEKSDSVAKLIITIAIIIIQAFTLLSINIIKEEEIYSNKNLYSSIHSPLLTAEKFGLITMFRLDCQRSLFGFKEKEIEIEIPNTTTPSEEEPKEEEITYNELEIDWQQLIDNETNETIKSMHEYFSLQNPTNKNEYTAMFQGKNLIVFFECYRYCCYCYYSLSDKKIDNPLNLLS